MASPANEALLATILQAPNYTTASALMVTLPPARTG
jgi:hypothetical protein